MELVYLVKWSIKSLTACNKQTYPRFIADKVFHTNPVVLHNTYAFIYVAACHLFNSLVSDDQVYQVDQV